MGALQPWHLIVILVIVLVVFGPGRLPELGKSLGEGMRELKRATSGEEPAAATVHPVTAATVTTTQVEGEPATRQCPSCNTAVSATSKFCGSCGVSFAPAAVEPVIISH